jgi:hypothetical protein
MIVMLIALVWIGVCFARPVFHFHEQCNCLCCTPEENIKNDTIVVEPPPRARWRFLRGDDK